MVVGHSVLTRAIDATAPGCIAPSSWGSRGFWTPGWALALSQLERGRVGERAQPALGDQRSSTRPMRPVKIV